jgi:hypothetical protein
MKLQTQTHVNAQLLRTGLDERNQKKFQRLAKNYALTTQPIHTA